MRKQTFSAKGMARRFRRSAMRDCGSFWRTRRTHSRKRIVLPPGVAIHPALRRSCTHCAFRCCAMLATPTYQRPDQGRAAGRAPRRPSSSSYVSSDSRTGRLCGVFWRRARGEKGQWLCGGRTVTSDAAAVYAPLPGVSTGGTADGAREAGRRRHGAHGLDCRV